jgi:hypothetical protein
VSAAVAEIERPFRFAAHFRQHCTSALVVACQTQGLLVGLELIGFADAYAAVWQMARSRGATFLPDEIVEDLETWICTFLADEAGSHDADISNARRIADRVARQIDNHFREVARS